MKKMVDLSECADPIYLLPFTFYLLPLTVSWVVNPGASHVKVNVITLSRKRKFV